MQSSLVQARCEKVVRAAALLVATVIGAPICMQLAAQSADTASVHKTLRGAIDEFQDEWRGKWQSAEMKRHKAINLTEIRGYRPAMNGKVTPPVTVGDRERGNLTTDLRRYLSILCFVGTPRDKDIEEAKHISFTLDKRIIRSEGIAPGNATPTGVSWATPRQILSRPNTGAICPSWLPPEGNVPLDEGEAIDLALPINDRTAVRAQRAKLLAVLDAAQKQNPDDGWIAGQRVRFWFDQREMARTTAASNDCRANTSWCHLLKGFAHQAAADHPASEREFVLAETLAPASAIKDSLCGNSDVLMLLNHDDVDEIIKQPCNEQRTLIDRVWWLADPLWAVPGNERYIAHNVRKLHATLRAVTPRDERYVWANNGGGEAMRETVIRYGWPSYTYWAGRELDQELSTYREFWYEMNLFPVPPYTAKEYSPDRTALLPTGTAIFNPFTLNDNAWQLYAPTKIVDDWWPLEHAYLRTHIASLNAGQDIMWRRDSSIVYQLSIDAPLRSAGGSSTVAAKVVLMGGDGPTSTRTLAQSAVGEGQTLRLQTRLTSQPIVMSAEVLPRTEFEQAMRRRYAVAPPQTLREMKNGEVALSAPLLMRMPNRTMLVPVDEPGVLRYMAGDVTFAHDEPLAIYWESYGFAPGDTVDVELKFRQDDNLNAAQRLLGAVGIGGDRDSVSIKWREPDPRHASLIVSGSKPVIGRSLAVDLTALKGGAYVVSMEMRKGNTLAARSERRITVKQRAQ